MAYVLMCQLKPAGGANLESSVRVAARAALENGCIIRNIRNNGIRKMAYPYKGKGAGHRWHEAHFFSLEFFGPPKSVAAINQSCRTNEEVLRHSILKGENTLPRITPKMKEEIKRNRLQ